MRRGSGSSAPAPESPLAAFALFDSTLQAAIEPSQPSLPREPDSQAWPSLHSGTLNVTQAHPWRPKSPSYLTGKNPYGRILDNPNHPCQKSRSSSPGSPSQLPSQPPSQLGSNMGGRPRTTGSIGFATRPPPPHVPEQEVALDGPPTPSPLPLRRPPENVFSVKDAKCFFETKASESGQHPQLLPTKAAILRDVSIDPKVKQQPFQATAIEDEDDSRQSVTAKKTSAAALHVSRLQTETPKQRQSVQGINPSSRAKADSIVPKIMVRTATRAKKYANRKQGFQGYSLGIEEDHNSGSSYATETPASNHRKSTNVFREPKKPAQPLRGVQCSVVPYNRLDRVSNDVRSVNTDIEPPEQPPPSDETVRCRSTRKSFTAETDEVSPSTDSPRAAKMQRP